MGYYTEEVCKSFPVGWLFIRSPQRLRRFSRKLVCSWLFVCLCVCKKTGRYKKQPSWNRLFFQCLGDKKLIICIFHRLHHQKKHDQNCEGFNRQVTNQSNEFKRQRNKTVKTRHAYGAVGVSGCIWVHCMCVSPPVSSLPSMHRPARWVVTLLASELKAADDKSWNNRKIIQIWLVSRVLHKQQSFPVPPACFPANMESICPPSSCPVVAQALTHTHTHI